MAWRRSGDKPLSETMMIILPTHICVTRPQWVNPLVMDAWYQHGWDNNTPYEMWGEFVYPFSNFNGAALEIVEWISNFNPHITVLLKFTRATNPSTTPPYPHWTEPSLPKTFYRITKRRKTSMKYSLLIIIIFCMPYYSHAVMICTNICSYLICLIISESKLFDVDINRVIYKSNTIIWMKFLVLHAYYMQQIQ